MFEYLPELMKGLHTSLTLTVASLIVALILALIFTIILTLKTPVLVWLVRGYITLFTGTPLLADDHITERTFADLPDLLRTGPVPNVAGVSGTVAFVVRTVVMCADCVVAEQCGVHHAAVLRCDSRDPGRSMAVL